MLKSCGYGRGAEVGLLGFYPSRL